MAHFSSLTKKIEKKCRGETFLKNYALDLSIAWE